MAYEKHKRMAKEKANSLMKLLENITGEKAIVMIAFLIGCGEIMGRGGDMHLLEQIENAFEKAKP